MVQLLKKYIYSKYFGGGKERKLGFFLKSETEIRRQSIIPEQIHKNYTHLKSFNFYHMKPKTIYLTLPKKE
jgi:hypothetical protein